LFLLSLLEILKVIWENSRVPSLRKYYRIQQKLFAKKDIQRYVIYKNLLKLNIMGLDIFESRSLYIATL